MHEVAMALSVIRIAKKVGRESHLEQIRKIVIRKGALSGILEEAFLFAFESLKDERLEEEKTDNIEANEIECTFPKQDVPKLKLLKEAQIEFINLENSTECLACHRHFKLERYKKACPYCGGKDLYYPSAYDFFVESIEGE